MSLQSLLYHAFGLQDQEYLKTEYLEGEVIFHIRTKANKLRCSNCGSKDVISKGSVTRRFRTVNIGLKPVFLEAEIQRMHCKDCGVTRQEKITFADPKKTLLGPWSDML